MIAGNALAASLGSVTLTLLNLCYGMRWNIAPVPGQMATIFWLPKCC